MSAFIFTPWLLDIIEARPLCTPVKCTTHNSKKHFLHSAVWLWAQGHLHIWNSTVSSFNCSHKCEGTLLDSMSSIESRGCPLLRSVCVSCVSHQAYKRLLLGILLLKQWYQLLFWKGSCYSETMYIKESFDDVFMADWTLKVASGVSIKLFINKNKRNPLV